MIAKLLAAALVAVPVSASAPPALFVKFPAVHQVVCREGLGTAFEAGGHMISVNHVTSMHGCSIETKPITSVAESGLDFSTVNLPATGLKINCEGFKENELYWAIGYAFGAPVQRVITLVGTGRYDANGEAALLGYPTVIPGMSGGVIMNARGEAVGTVNMYITELPISLSRELRDTSVCANRESAPR